MFHRDMMEYYSFLSLPGFSEMQRYHFLEEIEGNDRLTDYYMRTCHRLLPKVVQYDSPIPKGWYNYVRQDVSVSDRQNGIRNGLNLWINWEKKTKSLYNSSYLSLLESKDPSASFVKTYLDDVTDELAEAEECQLSLSAMSYDLPTIVDGQGRFQKEYSKRIQKMWR